MSSRKYLKFPHCEIQNCSHLWEVMFSLLVKIVSLSKEDILDFVTSTHCVNQWIYSHQKIFRENTQYCFHEIFVKKVRVDLWISFPYCVPILNAGLFSLGIQEFSLPKILREINFVKIMVSMAAIKTFLFFQNHQNGI